LTLFEANAKLGVELGGVSHDSLYKMDFYEYSLHLKRLKEKRKDVQHNELIKVDRANGQDFVSADNL
jgi:hypothetical protein